MNELTCVFLIAILKTSESNRRTNADAAFIPPKDDNDYDEVIRPVPYGHIYKEGFGDIGGLKSPIDFLDLNIRHPMTSEEARDLLKKTDPKNIQFYSRYVEAKGYTNPRDKILKDLGISGPGPEINETQFRWFDLGDLEARNVAKQIFLNRPRINNGAYRLPPTPPPRPIDKKLLNLSFMPHNEKYMNNINFTTCNEFGNKAYFFPKDIINLDWVPFYVWAPERHTKAKIHLFKYATKKLVKTVRELYRKFIKIDWEQPKLLYHGVGNYLLVAVDKRGLFHALQLIDSPPAKIMETIPYTQLRLKIADPYLVMMYCTDFFATIMAVAGNEPQTDKEKEEEANTIGIKGPGWPVSRDIEEEQMVAKALRMEEMNKMQNKPINSDGSQKIDEVKEFAPPF